MKAMMTAAVSCLRPASAAGETCEQRQVHLQTWCALFLSLFLMLPVSASCEELNWSIGGYGGQYYDSEPAGLTQGRANFLNQYIVALTASRTIWRAETLPMALEIDATVAQQFGVASLSEFAIAPVLRWSGFPWKETLPTSLETEVRGLKAPTHWYRSSADSRSDPKRHSRHAWFRRLLGWD